MKVNSYKSKLQDNGTICMVAEKGYYVDGRKCYNSPQLLADFIGDEIGLRTEGEEYVYIICLDAGNHIIGLFEASHGAADASIVPVREICKKSLMLNAVNIVVTHNHPSGDVEPSEPDLLVTKKLRDAMDIIGIKVLDHVIVGGNTRMYYSFVENQI